jgi:ABC-type polysaccharide/polyol phosphate transport system ATPase subunit
MTAVIVDNVSLDFPIYGAHRGWRTAFKQAAGGLIQREGKHHERVVVKALVDISLKLEEGDRLGLVGHNGSGKSTLLKVLAGIYEPIQGQVLVQGRVTPLFEMMPGLDLEGDGYENILTAGLLLGLSRSEIEKKLPEIAEFSELGEYLDLPVRTYSAGMVTRLGFALATALDPGVLLMDEGIGAGDERFAERAAERMNEFVGRSRILVVASHSPKIIQSVCNKAALMEAGRIVAIGPVDVIFDQYRTGIRAPALPVREQKFGAG